MTRLTIAAMALLALGGCKSVPKYMHEVSNERALKAPPDRALVVFVRSSKLGFAIRGHIMDDQANFVGTAIAGGHFAVLRPPGKQKFLIWSETSDVLVADLAPGLVYFVEVNPAMGLMRARFSLKASHRGTDLFPFKKEWIEDTARYVVDEERAKEEMQDEAADRRDRLKDMAERVSEFSASELREHTLSQDDGHLSAGVPGTVGSAVNYPSTVPGTPAPAAVAVTPVAAVDPQTGVRRGFAKGALVRVKLKSGVQWLGEVVTETGSGLLVSTGTGTQMFNVADIAAIDPMGPAR